MTTRQRPKPSVHASLPEEERAVLRALEARSEAVTTFQRWAADPRTVYLDTETTGLVGVVIDVAVVDGEGSVLFDSRLRPLLPIEESARQIHGLTDEELAGAPEAREVLPELLKVLHGRKVVAFNAEFDTYRLEETGRLARVTAPKLEIECAMLAYAGFHGERDPYWGGWRRIGLKRACKQMGVPHEPELHRAVRGAHALAGLVQAVAGAGTS